MWKGDEFNWPSVIIIQYEVTVGATIKAQNVCRKGVETPWKQQQCYTVWFQRGLSNK